MVPADRRGLPRGEINDMFRDGLVEKIGHTLENPEVGNDPFDHAEEDGSPGAGHGIGGVDLEAVGVRG